MYFNNILETIGNTPLVKLNDTVKTVNAKVLAKIETTNPGNSIKDRMALKMIEEAEKSGELKPGGTIVEGTSGNTGMGLAIAAVIKGYSCIFVTNDKQSKEKVDMLKAVGAEVIVCPTDVEPDDPKSYYSVSKRLSTEIPNAFYSNQYHNPANAEAHYETTGPEIWEQTEGKITHFVVGVGTGGTISGAGRYLKEKNPNIKIIGIDTYGSALKKFHETGEFVDSEVYTYITEGIGEDIIPSCVDFSVIDQFEKVTDKDGLVYQRRLAREEGIMVGNSAGSAVAGIVQLQDQFKEDDVIVVIFHDHGSRYVGKAFNDEWMRERGFLAPKKVATAIDMIASHKDLPLITVNELDTVASAVKVMEKYGISQMPVVGESGDYTGALNDHELFKRIFNEPHLKEKNIQTVMDSPFPLVQPDSSIEEVSQLINKENPAVLVRDLSGTIHILTKYDLIAAIGD